VPAALPSASVGSWVWWLAGPAVTTVLACLVAWAAGRPKRLPGTRRAVREHRAFLSELDALAGRSRAAEELSGGG
jgi:hypothetical protein